jgi:FtsP/CotA-like multicopper oxidase with cupredoxin domain
MRGGFPNRRDLISLTLSGVVAGLVVRPALAEAEMPVVVIEKVRVPLLEDKQVMTEIIRMRINQGSGALTAKQGMPFQVDFVNTLDEEISLQFFGVRGPEAATHLVLPAKTTPIDPSLVMRFTPNDAGTFWIGPAQNAQRLRDLGLSAMFVVEEAVPQELADVSLAIDDWMIDERGVLDQDYGNLERLISTGRIGNWLTVNGKFKPRVSVPRSSPVRLRLLNAANMRVMKLSLRGVDALTLAVDGQPLPAMRPVGSDAINLAPGQRIDLLLPAVDSLVSLVADLDADAVEIAFIETQGTATPKDLPDNFRLPPNPLPAPAAQPRSIALSIEGGAQGGLVAAQVGIEKLELRQMLERGLAWAISGVAGPGGPVLFVAKQDETLSLEIENKTNFDQILCVLGHVWSLAELSGVARDLPVQADTVVLPAKAKAKLLMVAGQPGLWPIQSTQADRADGGLYATFAVEA